MTAHVTSTGTGPPTTFLHVSDERRAQKRLCGKSGSFSQLVLRMIRTLPPFLLHRFPHYAICLPQPTPQGSVSDLPAYHYAPYPLSTLGSTKPTQVS